jgi:hypothetical protein
MKNIMFGCLLFITTKMFGQDGMFIGTSVTTNQSCVFGQLESNFDRAFMRLEFGLNPMNTYFHLTMKLGIRVAKYGNFRIYTNIPTMKFEDRGISICPSVEMNYKKWLSVEIENHRQDFIVALKIRKHLF